MADIYVNSYTMSSFYNKIRTSNQYVSPESKTRNSVAVNDSMTDMINESDKFRTKIRRLDNYKRSKHQESKLIRDINSFVKEYNTFKKKADGTKDTQIDKKMNELEKLITDNKKELKKAGITLDNKNQLKFDSEEFSEINKSVFEGLFSGHNSFLKKANKIIRGISYYSKENEISEEKVSYHPTVNYSQNEMAVARACNTMDFIVSGVFNKADFRFESMSMMDFADVYNTILSRSPSTSSAVSALKAISSAKQDELLKLGITVEDNGRYTVEFPDDMDMDEVNTAFNSLFHDSPEGEPTDYVATIKQSIYEIFRNSLRTDTIGVTINQTV